MAQRRWAIQHRDVFSTSIDGVPLDSSCTRKFVYSYSAAAAVQRAAPVISVCKVYLYKFREGQHPSKLYVDILVDGESDFPATAEPFRRINHRS